MTLYKNKYRVESTRLGNRDYAANGLYFITICTDKRRHFFGNVQELEMQLSDIGKIAEQFWLEIPNHFQHTKIDSFVIMPNHVHGIIIIDKPKNDDDNLQTRYITSDPNNNIASHSNNLDNNASPQNISDESNQFGGLKPGSLQTIIHSYKSAVTRWCGKNGYEDFRWQPRFYETIIRTDYSLDNVRKYIDNNPIKWEYDKDNKPNLWM
jgi:putative transposase